MAIHREYRFVLVHTHTGDEWGVCRFTGPGRETNDYKYTSPEQAQNAGYAHMEFLFGYGQGFTTHSVDLQTRLVHDWEDD